MEGCYDCQKLTGGCCWRHSTYTFPPKQVHRCPVCEGRGTVPHGFYSAFGALTNNTAPETCKSCEGKGYVAI